MSHTDGCPAGRSQLLTLSRRELLRGLALVVLPSLTHSRLVSPFGHRRPKFTIGDKVCTSWVDETGESRSEQGEVFGVCWHPKNRQWGYLVVWRDKFFDEQLISSEDLEARYA
jgi:hypothetical protein